MRVYVYILQMEGRLQQLVASRRANPSTAELEVRLGSWHDGHFTPGVPRTIFEQLEKDMVASSLTPTSKFPQEFKDHFYTVKRGQQVRTRVGVDTRRMEITTEHVVKKPDGFVTFRRCDGGEQTGEVCRVACATEVAEAHPPSTCVPTHVRVKQRRRFEDVRLGKVVWAYELSKVWSGPSSSVVEHLQHTSEPVYEVECELVDEDGAYLANHTDAEVAESILLKAALLMGNDGGGLEGVE